MTLTSEQSSNKGRLESETTENLIKTVRTAMDEGCIRPCHVYDAVNEVLCRLAKFEEERKNFVLVAKDAIDIRPMRNCDVFRTREETDKAYDKYAKWNMRRHAEDGDGGTSRLDYEDWFLADYNPKFYQTCMAKVESDGSKDQNR